MDNPDEQSWALNFRKLYFKRRAHKEQILSMSLNGQVFTRPFIQLIVLSGTPKLMRSKYQINQNCNRRVRLNGQVPRTS